MAFMTKTIDRDRLFQKKRNIEEEERMRGRGDDKSCPRPLILWIKGTTTQSPPRFKNWSLVLNSSRQKSDLNGFPAVFTVSFKK